MPKYNPSRGGHAPDDLRDAFVDLVEVFRLTDHDEPEPLTVVRGESLSIAAVCGLLWNCSDFTPPSLQYDFELMGVSPPPRTYAQAARDLKSLFVGTV